MSSTNLFTVSGKLYDGVLSTPLVSGRTTYQRDATAATGQVDIFATSGKFATVTFSGGPNLPAGEIFMNSDPGDTRVSNDVSSEFFSSTLLTPDATAVPAVVELNAIDTASGPTRLLRLVTDQVTITTAEYNADDGILTVEASSSDSNLTPALTIAEYGGISVPAQIVTQAPPATINVTSSAGGTHQLKVTVVDNNVPPEANNDNAITDEDVQFVIEVLANDVSATGIDPASLQIITSTLNGQAINNGDGTITYIPNLDFNGSDSLTYIVTGLNGLVSNEALVSITVNPVNDAPVAVDDLASTDNLTPITINVLANDSDVEGDILTVTAIDTATTVGSVTNDGTSLTYTPALGFSGIDTFSYTVSDGNGGTATAIVSVDVINLNSPPAAVDDAFTVAEDSGATVLDLLANDSDVNGDALTISAITQPAAGTGSVVNNGTNVSFTPDLDFNGAASFSYTISDGNGGTASANVTVNITPVNDAPVALDDAASTDNLTPITIDVLANDSDLEGDALSITDINLIGTAGSVTNNGTNLTYTPAAGFSGTDTFTYTVSDGNGGSATATVAVDVINQAPVAADDAFTVAEDSGATILDVLANDTDVNGDALTITAVTQPAAGIGSVVNNGTNLSFTPAPDFNGPATFSYTTSDGNGGTATANVSVNVTPVNDNPVAVDDTAATDNLNPVTVNVLANDSDVDGDALSVTATTAPANGTAVINADGTVTYTANTNFSGSDSFIYTVTDGNGGTASATVSVNVANVNLAPVAADDAYTVAEDSAATLLDVLANDSDANGDVLTISAVTQPAAGAGSVVNNGTSVSYTPALNFNGNATFSYTITDGNGATTTANVSVNVTPVNDNPVAVDDVAATDNLNPVTVNVLGNDSDVDGDALSVTATTAPANGTAVINADGTVTYTANTNFSGSDSFIYTVTDGNGGTASATVSVNVANVNLAPVAADDAYTVAEDSAATLLDVLANDSDANGDVLTISAVTQPAAGAGSVVNNGTSVSYTPALNFNGNATFSYTITDGNGATTTANVSVNVTPVNDNPIAVDDAAATDNLNPVTVNVLGNDSDVDGDVLSVTDATAPANGTAVINADGTITYSANVGFSGIDSFFYTVIDGNGGSASARVIVNVVNVNVAPVAQDDVYSVDEDSAANLLNVLANDSDVNGDALTITAITQPAPGAGSVVNNGSSMSYTPALNFNGSATFNYTITDGNGATTSANVTVNVTPVNDNPVAVDDAAATDNLTPVTVNVLANDSDVDGDALSVSAATAPTNGTVEINADGSITYTAIVGYAGPDSFAYTLSDGNGGSATATVTLDIIDVNVAPVAQDDLYTVAEDSGENQFSVLDNDSDANGDALTITAVTQPAEGSGSVVNNGSSVSYTPALNFNGSATFSYTISDGNGEITTANVSVNVNAVNDNPVAVDDAAATDNLTPVTVNVLGNDSDIDGDALSVTAATAPANGTAVVNADGTITYTAAAGFSGDDSFTYTVSDGNGGSATANVSVNVVNVNVAPVAQDDVYILDEDSGESLLSVLDNDSDVFGDVLTVTEVTQPAAGAGTVVNNGNNVSYTPAANFNGIATFSYTISDSFGEIAIANVVVNVTAVNDAPVAVDDAATTDTATPDTVTIDVLANDSDVDGDDLTVISTTAAANGTAVIDLVNSNITYTAVAGFSGTDSFDYTVSDGNGGTATATVTVNVVAVNVDPVDLDIYKLKTSPSVKAGKDVSIQLRVRQKSAAAGAQPATIVGVDRLGVEVYSQTMLVDGTTGRRRSTSVNFPSYTTTGNEGVIKWTATLNDSDPDLDRATSTTRVGRVHRDRNDDRRNDNSRNHD